MTVQAPALLVVGPLLTAGLVSVFGWIRRSWCFPLAVAGLALAFGSALELVFRVLTQGVVEYRLGGWPPPWGIAYRVDLLNAPFLAVASGAALVNLIASRRSIEADQQEKAPTFYALYALFVTGLLGILVTGDAFNLYVLLEIASLSGYALVAAGNERAPLASLNYVILGTIGASFYLLGVGFIYMVTGSLNMMDIARLLPEISQSRAVLVAFALIMVGVWVKAAFFPLHAWLPAAYTNAPAASSGLLAPLMTKVMIYVMIRFMVTVFGPGFVFERVHLGPGVVWLATAAIVAGAVMALASKDMKKAATYIILTEVGYMVGGAWLGNRAGLTGATLHVFNDALMTLCVFLVLANVGWRMKSCDLNRFPGLFRKMPFTMGALVVTGLSIVGVPPTCGFFSKWYLLQGAIQAGHYGFLAALLFSSLAMLALFFRVFEIAFFEGQTGHGHGHAHGDQAAPEATILAEAPVEMVVMLLAATLGLILAGLGTGFLVRSFFDPAVPLSLL